MIYPFRELRNGEVVGPIEGFDFEVAKAPPIGKVIKRRGKKWRRVVDVATVYVDHNGDSPYVASSLPLNYEPHKKAGGRFAKPGEKIGGRLCRGGEPIMESKRQQHRTQNAARDFSEYDQIRNPKLEPFRSRT